MKRVAALCLFLGAAGAVTHAADVLSQLGITLEAAKEAVDSVITSGVYNPGLPAAAFKLMPAATRADVATAGVAWLKAFTASADFKKQYAQIRQVHKPTAPEITGTPEDELKKADDEQQRQMEESKKALAALPAAQRAQLEETMKATQAQLNTPEMRKIRLEGIKLMRAERTKQYDQEMATWNRNFPESAGPVIAKRLREFLAASDGVDFTAKLVSKNGRMVFENPAYEQKPSQWKMCFRAGKEATGAARAAAQAWLKELGG